MSMLEHFFQPRSVAVIGASASKGKVGHEVLLNVIEGGYEGNIYPVNPHASEVLGLKAYPSVLQVDSPIDLAVIVIPRQAVWEVLEECGKKRIDSIIVITAGFKEVGPEGTALERKLIARARELGIRILGPNCLGLIDTSSKLNASFMPGMPTRGNIAFFSQSGALGVALLDWALGEGIGFSKFVSLGNKADLDEIEMMNLLVQDPETRVILGYLEGVTNGEKFLRVAREVSRVKPLIIAKSGTSSAGARAASSHTGALAGSEKAFQAAFTQSGVIRASSLRDLLSYAIAFAEQPVPQGPNLAIVTNGGGPGIVATDACEKTRIRIAAFQSTTIETLRQSLPTAAAVYNPVDILGDAQADRYEKALRAVSADPNVHSILTILTPQAGLESETVAEVIGKVFQDSPKPALACLMGQAHVSKAIKRLHPYRVPNYAFPEDAIRALDSMIRYREWVNKPPPSYKYFQDVDKEKVRLTCSSARKGERCHFGELWAKDLVSAYGFRTPRSILAETSGEAVDAAEKIGYPVVMKIASPDILHKSDVGGVVLRISSSEQVQYTFQDMISRARRYMPMAVILGVVVQEMVTGGKEVILGMSRDPQFGPLIMFGLGGIYVEVLRDVSFRIAPLSVEDAAEMMPEIQSYPLLTGVRGEKALDLEAIQECLLRFSQLVIDFPQIVEADLNPLLVKASGEGAVVIDARFTVEEA